MIYRYFNNERFKNQFLDHGEIYFNSLNYFLDCEDEARRDPNEDVSIFSPKNGLTIKKERTNAPFQKNEPFVSAVRNPHRIFVYCTSTQKSPQLLKKFGATSVVKINDVEEFIRRMKVQLNNPLRRISEKQFLHGRVQYYDVETPPGTRWALPDEIVLSKTDYFSIEKEYRFAFALDKKAFVPYNIETTIGSKMDTRNKQKHHRILRIGNLRDICEILKVDEVEELP